MTLFHMVTAAIDIYKFVALLSWKFLGVLLLLLAAGQLLWQFWRWIDDAVDREEGNQNKDDLIAPTNRRHVLYGDLFKHWPFKVTKHELGAWWAVVFCISGVIAAVLIAFWPIVLVIGAIYGFGQAARGSRRLQKKVGKMMVALKDKSDKNHDHKGKYQEVK